MSKNLLIKTCCTFLLIYLFIPGKIFSQTYPLDTIMNRVYADIKLKSNFSQADSIADVYLSSLQPNGSWTDVNYSNSFLNGSTHLDRVLQLVQVYTSTGASHHSNAATYTAILKSLRFWYSASRTNSNWYPNDIGYPQTSGKIGIVMRYASTQLPSGLQDTLITKMGTGAINHSQVSAGANRADVSLQYLYRACLSNNATVMDTASIKGFIDAVYTTGGDGLTYDNGYLAHSGQEGINSYGPVFIGDELRMGSYFAGTTYALPSSKLPVIMGFYKKALLISGRSGYVSFNTQGRGVSRGSGSDHTKKFGSAITSYLDYARLIVPADHATWDSVANGTFQKSAQHGRFWRCDYDMHLRPGYTFNVQTVSNRTLRTETGNSENLLGKFLPDGSTAIQRWGGEYTNIYPIWEWDKIPGTTSRDFSTDAGCTFSGAAAGSTSFVGGVTDNVYGASAYDMNYNSVVAKKSWFYFDKEVVCLGAGITSTQTESIVSSVNQCWLYGTINVKNAGTVTSISSTANSATQYTSPNWVLHDSVGYFFPSGGNITVSNKTQSGSWTRINNIGAYSSDPLSGSVFNMWFNHGASPTKATYAYTVVPGLGSTTDMTNYAISNIRIVRNSDTLQAVRHLGLDMMQVVFYKAGTITDSAISVTVDKPCVVMLKNLHSTSVPFYIADPAQANSTINVTVKLPGISGTKQVQATLPVAPYKGSSVSYIISGSAPANYSDSLLTTADAYVRDGSYASTNYGTATSLTVKNDGTGYARQSYFKFDLTGITKPVTSAVLRLYSTGGGTTANTTQWQLYKSNNTTWTETGITWNNKPTGDVLLATVQGQTAAGYITWDITSQVNSLPANSTLTLQVVSTVVGSTTDVSFSSKEVTTNSQKPYIMFAYGGSSLIAQHPTADMAKVVVAAPQPAGLKLYPNPVKTYCVIEAGKRIQRADLYNENGSLVKKYENINANRLNLYMGNLAAGAYQLSIQGEGWKQNLKLIKL